MDQKYKSSVFSGIYTYEDIPPSQVKTLLEKLATNWLVPIFINGGGHIGSVVTYMDGWVEKNSIGRLTKGNWQQTINRHLGQYIAASVGGFFKDAPFTQAGLGGLMIQRPDWNSPSQEGKSAFVEFDIRPARLTGKDHVPLDIQAQFVNKTKEVCESINAEYAYITKDFRIALAGEVDSPFERFWRTVLTSKLLREYTRGYYWGNVLSDGIVEKIGGTEALQNQGFAVVEKFHRGWYVQITDDINNIDLTLLHRLRDILQPALPPPDYLVLTDKWQEQHSYFVL